MPEKKTTQFQPTFDLRGPYRRLPRRWPWWLKASACLFALAVILAVIFLFTTT